MYVRFSVKIARRIPYRDGQVMVAEHLVCTHTMNCQCTATISPLFVLSTSYLPVVRKH